MSSGPILALPEFFALKSKSNGKYLRYEPNANGTLEFSGDKIVSPFVKFRAEAVAHRQAGGGGPTTMYNLSCCYNNKYWRKASQPVSLISGGADAPEEDTSKWACTLFMAEFEGKGVVRLLHAHSNSYLGQSGPDRVLVVGRREQAEVCEVVDYSEAVVLLPKLVAFKGDNGKYVKHASIHVPPPGPLSLVMPGSWLLPILGAPAIIGSKFMPDMSYWVNALQFSVDTIEDLSAAHHVFVNPSDATIRIQSVATGNFWRRDADHEDWIRCDSTDATFDNKDTVFQVVRVAESGNSENVQIALRNCGNGLFCKRFWDSGIGSCLRANVPHVDGYSHLVVEEPVKQRRIFDVDIRTDDVRTVTVSTMKDPGHKIFPNGTSTTRKLKHKFVSTETASATWSRTMAWKIGGKLTVDFKIPGTGFLSKFLGGAKLEISGEYSQGEMKGGTNTTTTTKEIEEDYTVPPMKQVRLSMEERTTTREVPFSYSYTDKLYNDEEAVTYRLEDGLLTSTTTTQVIVPIEEPLNL
ncbi:unnamed protein product [Linum tenue]|uniref:Agglutinin domain-containing protein n=1 Tax=Linum tenue TaxID=586396 RepID=A0AAV0N7L7_9ROSI|nr:unnamed protein product [Linum tenue]